MTTASSLNQPILYHLASVNLGKAVPLRVGQRKLLSGIGKREVTGAVPVGALGLLGDEQADLSVHGGLSKAVYAYPQAHYPAWQARRKARGISLFDDDALPCGFMGENLTLNGLLEEQVWIGDTLQFANCRLRVTEPRMPCGKFNAVMGYAQAARDMAQSGQCGFYLAVEEPGTVQAGESFTLVPGRRALGLLNAFGARSSVYLR